MSFRSIRRRGGRLRPCLSALALAAGLAACNPIDTYRSVRGLDKNDPNPGTAPYNDSLAKGLDRPYPNLASVPPPPSIGSTVAERQKLTETLTAQRTNLQGPDAQGKPGAPNAGPVPPMPPLPDVLEGPVPPPVAVAAAGPTTPGGGAAKPEPHSGRKMDEPPLPGPIETDAKAPGVPALPNAEAPKPAPSMASLPPIPSVAPAVIAPAATKSAKPEPAPPSPVLPEAKPSPVAAARPPPKIPAVGTTVATLDLPTGSPALGGDGRARLDPVVAAYKQKPTTVRVVAYAAAATGSAEQLNSFRAALDRAQAVAKALTEGGVPADKIQTEASPAEAATPAGRVEVRLLP